MSTPDRVRHQGHGYRFRVRPAVTRSGTLFLGIVLTIVAAVMAAAVCGLGSVAVSTAIQAVTTQIGAGAELAEFPIAGLMALSMYGAPSLVCWMAWSRWGRRRDHHLEVEGRRARLLRADQTLWTGSVDDVRLSEGSPYWLLVAGPERFRIINPEPELHWLADDLQRRAEGAGTRTDVPTHLAGIARLQAPEVG